MKKPLFEIDPDSEVKGTGGGYIYVTTTPDHPPIGAGHRIKDHLKTYVPLHIVTVENARGSLISPEEEEVHHIDENPKNNALSNLEVRAPGAHAKGHKFWKKSPRTKPGQKRKKMALNIISKFRARVMSTAHG
jgi:hypothetical protein